MSSLLFGVDTRDITTYGAVALVLAAAFTPSMLRCGQTDRPRQTLEEANTAPNSRHIPAAVRRAVWERDGGRCTFVEEDGRRCKEQNQLEFHHQRPFARGGDHSIDNVALLCRAHNVYLGDVPAAVEFGRVAAAPVNTLRQQPHRCQEISVCF